VADAAAEDHQVGVEHRGDRGDDQGQPFALLADGGQRGRESLACGVEDVPGAARLRHAQGPGAAHHGLGGDRVLERAASW
jgi:hypothetical protein